jgi:signal transduction histidine kinase
LAPGTLWTVSDQNAQPLAQDTASVRWGAVIALEAALSTLVGLTIVFLWGVTGGGFFWPAWVWFALAVPLVAQGAVRVALRAPAGRWRGLAVHAAVSGTIWAILLAIVVVAMPQPRERERELAERVDQLTRTRMGALDVQAAELRRIERDLHDGAQARLVALSMQLGRAEERLGDRPEVAELVRQAREEAGNAIAELRDLARGIAPPVLADRGLVAAAEALGRRAPMPVTVTAAVERRPLPVVETAAYFVVAEALTNAAKHARGAPAHVDLAERDMRLVIEVSDEGPGGADEQGAGLTGLRHRVAALDGTLAVTTREGGGTVVHAELPCGW